MSYPISKPISLVCLKLAKALIPAFLNARYLENDAGGERLAKRVAKIKKIESGQSVI